MARGRPPKAYSKHDPTDEDRDRLAAHLAHGFQREGPYPTWYVAAAHERLGDDMTAAWLDAYKAMYPADWRRMLRNTRHAERGTLKGPLPRYTVWGERTAKDKGERDIGFVYQASTDPSTTGGSAGGVDVNEYFTGDLARFHYDADSFSPDELRRRLWGRMADEDVRYHYLQAMERLMTEVASVLWAWSPPVTTGLLRRGAAWLDPTQRSDEDRDLFREVSGRLRASRRLLSLSRLLSERPRESDFSFDPNCECAENTEPSEVMADDDTESRGI